MLKSTALHTLPSATFKKRRREQPRERHAAAIEQQRVDEAAKTLREQVARKVPRMCEQNEIERISGRAVDQREHGAADGAGHDIDITCEIDVQVFTDDDGDAASNWKIERTKE